MIITKKELLQATKKFHEELQFGKQISLGTASASRMWHWNYKSCGIWDAIKEFVRVTHEQLVKQDVFSAVLEVCILTYLQLYKCKFVIFSYSVTFFISFSRSIWVYPVLTCKIFTLHRGWNVKRADFIYPTGPAHPSRQFAVLSDSES